MSPEFWALLGGVAVVAIPATATFVVAWRRRNVGDAEALDAITAAAERVVRNVTEDNDRLARAVRELRVDVADFRDQLRTARSEVSSLRAELARERVAHDETREQVQTLLHEVRRLSDDIDPNTPPFGTPPVVGL